MIRKTIRALLFTLCFAAPAWAQGPAETATSAAPPAAATPPSPQPKPLPNGFVPLAGKEAAAESVDANTLVVLAYAAFFLAMFGFVIYVVRAQSALAREIQELSGKLERAEKR
jgi:hypothetical protein